MKRTHSHEMLEIRLRESSDFVSNDFRVEMEKIYFSSNVRKLARTLINYFELKENYPPPPYSDEEILQDYKRIFQPFEKVINNLQTKNCSKQIADAFEKMDISDILICLGQRITPASVRDKRALPPHHDKLILSASVMFNDKLNIAARSLAKHAYRCPENYWGKIEGPPENQNKNAIIIIDELLTKHTWWNVFGHFKHNFIFEIRDRTGHGARWSLEGEFIGFVEAIDFMSGHEFISEQL